ncbi:AP endonuclease [Venturia nashicola]|nr:AP endonuclease [Venturia nashicola]
MAESPASTLSSPPSEIDTSATSTAPEPSKGKKRQAGPIVPPASRSKRARKTAVYIEAGEEEEEIAEKQTVTKGTPRSKKAKVVTTSIKEEEEIEINASQSEGAESPKKVIKSRSKAKKVVKKEEVEEDGTAKKKVARKKKTKQEKEAEAMPLLARTLGSKIVVGAHISSAGGVQNAIPNSVHIGGNAFALFLKSQRKWTNPSLQDEQATQFLSNCKEHKYDYGHNHTPPIVPHGSYLVNLAHPDADRTKQAYDSFIDDLDRCRRLGIVLYNFHPGNCAGSSNRTAGLAHLAKQLNKAHKDPTSGTVITLLETMAASGNTLGSTFEDIAEVISLVEKKDRVGVCLDTCHIFAAGYDLRTPKAYKSTIKKFDDVIGLKYLRAFHMNDSKAPLSSGRDLHANIGTGFLGLRSFHNLVNDERMWGLPMVLETPIDVKDKETGKEVPDKSIWAKEIKLLESLVGMDTESEEFLTLEKELQEKGVSERERVQAQVDKLEEKKKRKEEKAKAATMKNTKKAKKEESASEESGSD